MLNYAQIKLFLDWRWASLLTENAEPIRKEKKAFPISSHPDWLAAESSKSGQTDETDGRRIQFGVSTQIHHFFLIYKM